jgi:hypothetical protein
MSLDNFFDKMNTLNTRRLVHLPCSFVETRKIESVSLPHEYKEAVEYYYPECDIVEGPLDIVVVKYE